jgi:uncharacterized protein
VSDASTPSPEPNTSAASPAQAPTPEAKPAPVAGKDRFESLDVLRGVAVLGILMVNAPTFFYYWGAFEYPPAHMDVTGANADAWRVMAVFFEQKFITIFSALFGAGIMLIVGEAADASTKLHYRRMLWLLAFGVIHGFLFWFGDILTAYALIGMIAVLFRRMSVLKLVLLGIGGILLTNMLIVASEYANTLSPAVLEPAPFGIVPDEDTLSSWVNAYQSGFWPSRIFNAIGNLIAQMSSIIFFGPRVLGVMLIGMALYKTGFLLARWSTLSYAALAVVCLGVGLPALWLVTGPVVESGFALETMAVAGSVNAFASLIVALGYASLVMLLCKIPWMKLIRYPFAAAGRMAFTNYLTQTLTMVALATGVFAAPLFGVIERADLVMVVLAVWLAQLIISPLWLLVFRFGPFEWLWRCLSYGKFQPILKAKA